VSSRGSAGEPAAGKARSTFREWVQLIAVALFLALTVRAFVIEAFRIPSESMEDTLLVGDFLFANKFIYGAKIPFTNLRLPAIREPRAGDIIVFQYPEDPSKAFIKRCVAVEGQTVEVRGRQLYVDGERVEEDYAKYTRADPHENAGPFVVPEGHLFMMGDNRDNSLDSRRWGPLDKDLVKGKALFIYFSWDTHRRSIRFSRLGHLVR
jgi:signal peptidase I